MAKILSKTGITTDSIIAAAHISQSIDALTGDVAYDITVSGSFTTTGSLKALGNITNTGNLTTSGTITGTNIQSNASIAAAGNMTINGSSTFGDAITDTLTIKGNITGSGNITLASYVSGSTIIGNKNGIAQNNSSEIDETMTKTSFPPGSVTGVTQTTGNNEVTYTLPAAEAGLHYTFIATETSTGTAPTTFAAPSAILNGIAICDNGTEDITGTSFQINAGKFVKGTRIYYVSDGTIWHITAFCLCDLADVATS